MILLKSPCCLLLAELDIAPTTHWRLRWDWGWPLWLTLLLVGVAIAWVVFSYSRESSINAGLGMRSFLARH